MRAGSAPHCHHGKPCSNVHVRDWCAWKKTRGQASRRPHHWLHCICVHACAPCPRWQGSQRQLHLSSCLACLIQQRMGALALLSGHAVRNSVQGYPPLENHCPPRGARPSCRLLAPEHLLTCSGTCHAATSPVKVDTCACCSLCKHAARSQAVVHLLDSTSQHHAVEALRALIRARSLRQCGGHRPVGARSCACKTKTYHKRRAEVLQAVQCFRLPHSGQAPQAAHLALGLGILQRLQLLCRSVLHLKDHWLWAVWQHLLRS